MEQIRRSIANCMTRCARPFSVSGWWHARDVTAEQSSVDSHEPAPQRLSRRGAQLAQVHVTTAAVTSALRAFSQVCRRSAPFHLLCGRDWQRGVSPEDAIAAGLKALDEHDQQRLPKPVDNIHKEQGGAGPQG